MARNFHTISFPVVSPFVLGLWRKQSVIDPIPISTLLVPDWTGGNYRLTHVAVDVTVGEETTTRGERFQFLPHKAWKKRHRQDYFSFPVSLLPVIFI
jgi:hypothetical protein